MFYKWILFTLIDSKSVNAVHLLPRAGIPNGVPVIQIPPPSTFCLASNLLASDGTQIKSGSCSSTVQGSIPSVNNMVSTLIVSPSNGQNVDSSKDICRPW